MRMLLIIGFAIALATAARAEAAANPATRVVPLASGRTGDTSGRFVFIQEEVQPGVFQIDIYSTKKPNQRLAVITNPAVGLSGVDAAGNISWAAYDTNGQLGTLYSLAPPYTESPSGCTAPVQVLYAVAPDGKRYGTIPTGLGVAVFPPNGCAPLLSFANPLVNYATLGVGLHGELALSVGDYDGLWYGVLTYPSGSDQAVDRGIHIPSPRTIDKTLVDRAGDLVLSVGGIPPSRYADIEVFPPGATTPSKTFTQTGFYHQYDMQFDLSRTHLFLAGLSGGVVEYAWPSFTMIRTIAPSVASIQNLAVGPEVAL